MKISTINPDKDLEMVAQVTKQAFSSTPDSNLDDWLSIVEMGKSITEKRGVCLKVVDENGEMIGTVHAMQENPINGREGTEKWVITNIAVMPSETGKGIGEELLRAIEKETRDRKVKKLFVHTNLKDEQVIHFYEKNGYKRMGKIEDYYYDGSAIFLLKYL